MEAIVSILIVALALFIVHEFLFPTNEIQIEALKEQIQEITKYESAVIRVDWTYPFILNRAIGLPHWIIKLWYRRRYGKGKR